MWVLTGLALILLGLCTYTDVRKREIPVLFLLLFLLLSFFYRGAFGKWWMGFWELLLRFLSGGILLLVHALKKKWLGLGDALLVLVCGYMTGAQMILATVCAAFLSSGLCALLLLLTGKRKSGDTLPFVPFLLLGFIIAIIMNRPVIWNGGWS
ncbi:MAG: prepilin peptidase [Lachnospiraceae bacterium]|nr:prepilin peptidase [Lachnospiraceae bacterium]